MPGALSLSRPCSDERPRGDYDAPRRDNYNQREEYGTGNNSSRRDDEYSGGGRDRGRGDDYDGPRGGRRDDFRHPKGELRGDAEIDYARRSREEEEPAQRRREGGYRNEGLDEDRGGYGRDSGNLRSQEYGGGREERDTRQVGYGREQDDSRSQEYGGDRSRNEDNYQRSGGGGGGSYGRQDEREEERSSSYQPPKPAPKMHFPASEAKAEPNPFIKPATELAGDTTNLLKSGAKDAVVRALDRCLS